jgi:tetraacyldisaccharide 4'-kinase
MDWRNARYDQGQRPIYHAPLPIVSVGNISAGGTGKTPFAEYLLRLYAGQGARVAYLSRGYGRKSKGYLRVAPEAGDAQSFGDEALQVGSKFPHLPVAVCEDRKTGIERLLQEAPKPELVVLDDAFQHRKVARNLDLLMIDANRLPDEDRLLPAGRLREPISGLSRSDFLIVNKLSDPERIPALKARLQAWQKPMAFCRPILSEIRDGTSGQLLTWQPKRHRMGAVLFSGLGNNPFFQQQVKEWGIEPVAALSFPDHHRYRRRDLAKIARTFHHHSEKSANFDSFLLLTTEKDHYRLKGNPATQMLADIPWAYLPIELAFWEGQQKLESLLLALINR